MGELGGLAVAKDSSGGGSKGQGPNATNGGGAGEANQSVRMVTLNSLFKRTLKFHSFGDITFGRGVPWPQMLGFALSFAACWVLVAGRLLGLGMIDSFGLSVCTAALVTFVISHLSLFGRNPFLEIAAITKHLSGPRYYLGMKVLTRLPVVGALVPSTEERRLKAMLDHEKSLGESGRSRPIDQVIGDLKETGVSVMRHQRINKLDG